jgi:4,4'-diaponeurosporenoate glycosyltransferase
VSGLQLVLVAAGLLAGLWLLADARPVPRGRGGGVADGVRVSVVIPARDEAATLPRLLGSLAACEPAPDEVIVVDDRSSDGTAAAAAACGATVLSPPEPPAGWVGKPWACQHGADAATGTHLLFLDADTWLSPDALPRLLARYGGGLLSVAPRHEADRPYEQLSAAFQLAGAMGTGVFAPTARRREARAAFGPCLLTDRAGYRAAGGHGAVRDHVIEDVALARRYRAAGLPVRCLTGGDAVGYRMYPGGVRQLVEGWSKNIASGVGEVGAGAPLATLGAVAWVTACLSVAASLGAGLAGWATGGGPPAVGAAAYGAVAAQWWWLLRRVGRFRWWAWAGFGLSLAAFLVIFANSARLTFLRRRVTWRGRAISLRPGPSGPAPKAPRAE